MYVTFGRLTEAARERSDDFAVLQNGERYKCLIKRLWLAGVNTISLRYTYNLNRPKFVSGDKKLIFDLHIHSKYSGDCAMEPATILKVAKKKGLDGIAVTDHLTIKGGIETRKLNNDPDFLVIVGSEVETNNKEDLIGLFLEEDIESRNAADVITEIKAQGGVVFWAHPFRFGKNLLLGNVIEQLDLIEGFNSKTSASCNELAKQLAREYDKPIIGTSDAHQTFEVGNGKTLLGDSGFGTIKEALASGKTQIVDSHLSYDYLDDMR